MARPLLLLSLALAAGALLGEGADVSTAGWLLLVAAALLVLSLLTQGRAAVGGLVASALALGAAAAGVETAAFASTPLLRWLEDEMQGGTDPVRLRGVAVEDAREAGDRWLITLEVETVAVAGVERPLPGRVRIEVSGQVARTEIVEGDRVSLWAQLRAPRGFGNPGAFDLVAHSRRQGLHALGYCKSPRLVEIEGRGQAGRLTGAVVRARRWARHNLEESVLPGTERALVKAMVLGDRTGVDPDTSEAFRVAGTYHVLAISGAQVALVAGLLLWILRRLMAPPLLSAVVVSAALAFYAELVGGDPPVSRAAVMAIVLVGGRALDLDSDMANLLGLAGGLLLLHRPSAVRDVAFQLSFAATLGILLLTPALLRRCPALPLRLDLAIAASIAAQAPLAPLLILHFHRLPPAALILNLAAVPLSGAVLLTGLVVLLVSALAPPLASLAGDLAWMSAHALLRSGQIIRQFPSLDVRLPTPPLWAVALYVTGLILIPDPRRTRRALIVAGLGLLFLIVPASSLPADGRLHLTVLDVGQGDCLVVRSPRGRVWVVDAGGSYDPSFDIGEAVVGPYLWSQGVRRVEGLIVSHAHPDHVGGVPFLLRSFAVGEVWEGVAPSRDPGYAQLDKSLRASGVARTAVARGVRREWDGVRVEVLGPRAPSRPPWRVRNDDSVVVALRLGETRLLLTGDVEGRGEAELRAGPADIVKIPHHGSRSSSTPSFVSATSPRVAVVSVGFRNRFGHPHEDVLLRYERQGARIFRTDRDGAVTVSTDGTRIWVSSFRGGVEHRIR